MRRPADVSGPLVVQRSHGMTRQGTGPARAKEGPLELDLRIEAREGLAGTLSRKDQAKVTSFWGWLGLAEAIDELRREAGHPDASKQLGAEPERLS
jgi:hypothetical protein